jgi:hypothetical protein
MDNDDLGWCFWDYRLALTILLTVLDEDSHIFSPRVFTVG